MKQTYNANSVQKMIVDLDAQNKLSSTNDPAEILKNKVILMP